MGDLRKLLPAIVVGVMGNTGIYLIPLLIGAMVADRGFTDQQAGLVASADLAGYAVMTFVTAMFLIHRNWRRMALVGVAIMFVANIATTFVSTAGAIRGRALSQRHRRRHPGGHCNGLARSIGQARPQLRLPVRGLAAVRHRRPLGVAAAAGPQRPERRVRLHRAAGRRRGIPIDVAAGRWNAAGAGVRQLNSATQLGAGRPRAAVDHALLGATKRPLCLHGTHW